MSDFLFHGAMRSCGHYAWTPSRIDERATEREVAASMGWEYLDNPQRLREALRIGGQEEGAGVRYESGGWTLINFWDRGGDSRSGSHSMFAVRGSHSSDDVLAVAREVMPPHYWPSRSFSIRIQDATS